jgi:hypothetical protein
MNGPDADALRAKAEAAACPGIVALIDFLDEQRRAGNRIAKIGSASVDFHGRVKALKARPHAFEEYRTLVDSLPHFHFGRADGKRTPIEDIANVLEGIEKVGPAERAKFDRFCLELARNDVEFETIQGKLILTQPVQ